MADLRIDPAVNWRHGVRITNRTVIGPMVQGARVPRFVRERMVLSTREVDFDVRGFRTDNPQRARLEAVGAALLDGYNAVVQDDFADPAETLARVDSPLRGFAYEGAGMACAMLDVLTVSRGRRLTALLGGSGDAYLHLVLVGVGLGLAQLRLPGWGGLRGLHPLYRWLVVDGRGFWQGFFQHRRHLAAKRAARPVHGTDARVRDQGLGRSLWFVECADVAAITSRIAGFHESRHADLWAGVGLAACYAGGADHAGLTRVVESGGAHRADLAQGAAFAAVARVRSGVVPEYTAHAVKALTGADPTTAGEWEIAATRSLGNPSSIADYERVRQLTRQAWRAFVGEHV